ncbi:DEAD/DEAH box helicase family protein [Vulcanisaeta sp. JCM 14467]|uniref:DEAD/DEAH box helicase family protein n=1 Tax=Vulcanisaeta sp. JCM 14467 TaxID=1295370 RepID=UPI000AA8AF0D|nr:DEAD/DEAH box helicase family protein [Vulcanisaeta sp. JCM 14467]
MLFRVVINGDVEIRREWPWDRVSRVKDRLKELGFRWNSEYWSGKVYSVSLIRELKDLLELTSEETERLMRTILVNSSGGVIGVEDLSSLGSIPSDCVLGEEGGLFIISLSCLIRDFIKNDRNYIGSASSFEEYVDRAVDGIRQLLAGKAVVGDLELALKRAREFALANSKLRDLYSRRVEWWTARLGLDSAELHFLSKELYEKLRGLTVPYYITDKEGNLNKRDLRLIRKDDIVRSGDKVMVRFPVFLRDTVRELLVKSGYRVVDLPWSPRQIQVPKDDVKLLPFQERALEAWLRAGKRGTIVVPTGGGKTFIALKALASVRVPTIILVITEELMNQWYERIMKNLGVRAGRLGGGYDDVREVTVAIYNSAVNRIAEISDKFDMAVFDECLPYDALVVTDMGLMPIGEIVERRLPVRVLTHKGRFMRVTNYFKIPLIKRIVRIIHEKGELVVTEDHLILTQGGWKPAIALRSGDTVYFYGKQVPSLRVGSSSTPGPKESLSYNTQLRFFRT